eukprot:TRINITY_DN13171_c0_g1_i2.p1 TRINITY_DN13171_c0_g1~~TRINITY_DN13171_c0_g1_i2.p1  ORF type:complete len:346 (+),score=71.24 TRINITY_DN13171_c0_g1_i2:149-1186(+)
MLRSLVGSEMCIRDRIGGTSAGGILAVSLAIFGKSPWELDQDWEECPEQFSGVYNDIMTAMFSPEHLVSDSSLFSDKYSPLAIDALYDTLDTHMKDPDVSLESRLYDTSHKCRFFTISCLMCDPASAHVFRNYGHRVDSIAKYPCTMEASVWEAIRATSAAPTYFPTCSVRGGDGWERHMDGGIIANNPAALAITEAVHAWGADVPIECVVSLGTGFPPPTRYFTGAHEPAPTPGHTAGAMSPLVSAVLNWTNLDVLKYLQAGAADVCVPDATLSGVIAGHAATYLRFLVVDEAFKVELDESDWRKLAAMRSAAKRYLEKHPRCVDMFRTLAAMAKETQPSAPET